MKTMADISRIVDLFELYGSYKKSNPRTEHIPEHREKVSAQGQGCTGGTGREGLGCGYSRCAERAQLSAGLPGGLSSGGEPGGEETLGA